MPGRGASPERLSESADTCTGNFYASLFRGAEGWEAILPN